MLYNNTTKYMLRTDQNMGISFKQWNFDKDLESQDTLLEFELTFGKHKGKDHTKADSGWLAWSLENVTNPKLLSPQQKQEIQAELNRRRSGAGPASASAVSKPAMPAVPTNTWILAKSNEKKDNLEINDIVAIQKIDEDTWRYTALDPSKGIRTGRFPSLEVTTRFRTVRDESNNVIQGTVPDLRSKYDYALSQKEDNAAPQQPQNTNKHVLTSEMMTNEQNAIDKKFETMMNSKDQNHMVINALAGSGKTTMLKHLAHKYGKQGEKWLYIVFNSKNRVEAKEKFPTFVDVETSNSFLGKVLGSKENFDKIHPTDLAVSQRVNLGAGTEKVKVLADAQGFYNMLNYHKIPDPEIYGKTKMSWVINAVRYSIKEQAVKLVGLCKSFAVSPKDKNFMEKIKEVMDKYDFETNIEGLKNTVKKTKSELIPQLDEAFGTDFMSRDFEKEIIEGCALLLRETMPGVTKEKYENKDGKNIQLKNVRDFNDDIWFPAIHSEEIHFPHYDVVLADEVQDFNPAQKIVLEKLSHAGAKIVAVGDPNQAIYRFRGADGKAFDTLGSTLKNLSKDKNVEMGLTENFRSRKEILDFVNKETHVKNLKAGKEFKDGQKGIVTKDELEYDKILEGIKKEISEKGTVEKETAFIARTNEPLVMAALHMMKMNIPFIIMGKDISKDIIKQINVVSSTMNINENRDSVNKFMFSINDFLEEENNIHAGSASKSNYLKELRETSDAIISALNQFIAENGGTETVAKFKIWIRNKLGGVDADTSAGFKEYEEKKKKENPVVLTTAHRSKGLEFSRVYILRNDLFPHPNSKREEDKKQEENARYVAYTRAMDELHLPKLKGQPGYKDISPG